MDIHDNAKKTWKTFLFKDFIFYFFKMSILGGISKTNHHLLIIDGTYYPKIDLKNIRIRFIYNHFALLHVTCTLTPRCILF